MENFSDKKSPRRTGTFRDLLLESFLDLSSLTNSVTQIVELSTANLTVSNYLYLLDNGRVQGEYSFDTAAVSYTSYGKGLADTAVLLSDNGALEYLYSALLAFLDQNVYLDGITDTELRNVLLHAVLCNKL